MWRKQNPHALILLVQSLWETIWSFLKTLNLNLPYKPTILLLGIYPREMKIYGHTKICIQMFTEALFIIVKQMRTVHTSILVNAQWFKKKKRRKLWYILQVNDPQKHYVKKKTDTKTTYCVIPFTWNTQKKQIYRQIARGGNGNPWNGNSLLKNFMGRGAWWATVHGVTKSWTWLSN